MKGIFLIGFAIFIDALQAAFALMFAALQAVTPVGGGFGAAAVCAAFSNGIVDKLVNGVTCLFVGAGASAFAVPIGAAVDVALSITLGGALIAALVFTGTFSLSAVMGGSIVEIVPILDSIAPGWTLMAWRCIKQAKLREQEAEAKEIALLSTMPLGAAPAFDGIRATNDNFYEAQIAA